MSIAVSSPVLPFKKKKIDKRKEPVFLQDWYKFDSNCTDIGHIYLAPAAETGFSHRFTAYKIVGHFFGLSYRKISGSNQVKNSFFRISNISVPCPHAQLRGRTVIQKLWTFFGPWGRDRSQSPPCWIFRVKQMHPSTASERTTLQIFTHLKLWVAVAKHNFRWVKNNILSKTKFYYLAFQPLQRGIHFSGQNLTSVDVRF